jgi:hypothetical protein
MRANQSRPGESGGNRGSRFELFFYERRGDHYHLRLTGLAVILISGLVAVSIIAILLIFLFRNSRGDLDNVNINVVTPPASPLPANTSLIKQPPLPSPPKVNRPQPVVVPTPLNLPTPDANANARPGATPTPRLDALKPPP